MCEAAGIPVGLATDGANRNDCELTEPTIDSVPTERPDPTPEQPQDVCLDKAYDHEFVRDLRAEHDLTPHIRSRGEEAQELATISATALGAGSPSASTHGSTATVAC